MARALDPDALVALAAALGDGRLHRGPELAERFGVSRQTIANRIAELRRWGLPVSVLRSRGYLLEGPSEPLQPPVVRRHAPPGLPVEIAGVVDSTNSSLLADARPGPRALLAEAQTGGRGRLGRRWCSPPGRNVYLSVRHDFAAPPAQIGCLPLAMGVAVWRWLRALGVPCGLKWPNDIWSGGRKLAGLLVEHRGELGSACRIVVGLGLNTAATTAADGAAPVGLDELLGRRAPSRSRAAGELAAVLDAALRTLAAQGFAPFAADFDRADLLRGRPVRVLGAGPGREGIAAGIRADGALLLRRPGGQLEAVTSGDVSLRPG